MRLLLVEDDPAIADVLRQALTEEGYGVDHAVTTREGEAQTRLFPYDVLILDVMLPGGADAGWTLARNLRAGGYDAPVLFLIARSETDDLVSGFEAGGDDYLAKPFALKELLVRVQAEKRRGVPSAVKRSWRPDTFGTRPPVLADARLTFSVYGAYGHHQ